MDYNRFYPFFPLQFWEIGSQTRVSFYATQSSYLLKTWGGGKVIWHVLQKCIVEQSSVIQYAWLICHLKEE